MRLIKRQTTNLRSIAGKGVQYDIDNQVIVDSERALLVPKGGYWQQPGFAGDGIYPDAVETGAVNGQLRYRVDNSGTDEGEFEVYQDGAWRNLRFKEPNRNPGIIWQLIGTGDATETVFGELDSQDHDDRYTAPAAAEHIVVLIENVVQLPQTNYTIHQTAEITSGGPLEGPNAPYTSTGSGWWIKFTSPVPLGKPITVIHNLDK